MILTVTIPADTDTDPNDPAILALVEGQAARQATTWTAPVHTGETTSDTGRRLLTYTVDAVPRRTPGVTTANIAPALMPARIVR